MINPFVTKGYVSAKYFCDREKESNLFLKEIENGNDIALIATRKIGKSGLISHCFNEFGLAEKYNLFFIDLYSTCSLREMVYLMSRSIVKELAPKGTVILQRFLAVMKSLSFTVTSDASGMPQFGLQLGDIQEPQATLEEIFNYLEGSDKPNIVAIDEFQQIANYPENNVEALLRTYIQNSHNSRFIFSGSQHHLMGEIFTSAKHPFYQSASVLHLNPIDKEKYTTFACNLFASYGKTLDSKVVDELYLRFDGVTWYLQKVLNAMFSMQSESGHYGIEEMEEAIRFIVDSNDYTYAEKMAQLPEKQKALLLALNREGKANHITSVGFVKRHKLYSTSAVQSACNSLIDKEMISEEFGYYFVYDRFFGLWLKDNF